MSSDEVVTTADFEAFGRGVLSQHGAAARQGREAADAALSAKPSGTVRETEQQTLLRLVAESKYGDPSRRQLAAAKRIAAEPEAVMAEFGERLAAERVRLQVQADRDVERTEAASPEGRQALAQTLLRRQEWEAERLREADALIEHEGQAPANFRELLSPQERIAHAQKPYVPGPIEVDDPTFAGRPPDAHRRPVVDDADDFELNERRADPEKYGS